MPGNSPLSDIPLVLILHGTSTLFVARWNSHFPVVNLIQKAHIPQQRVHFYLIAMPEMLEGNAMAAEDLEPS